MAYRAIGNASSANRGYILCRFGRNKFLSRRAASPRVYKAGGAYYCFAGIVTAFVFRLFVGAARLCRRTPRKRLFYFFISRGRRLVVALVIGCGLTFRITLQINALIIRTRLIVLAMAVLQTRLAFSATVCIGGRVRADARTRRTHFPAVASHIRTRIDALASAFAVCELSRRASALFASVAVDAFFANGCARIIR